MTRSTKCYCFTLILFTKENQCLSTYLSFGKTWLNRIKRLVKIVIEFGAFQKKETDHIKCPKWVT